MVTPTAVFGMGFLIACVLFVVWIVRISLGSETHRPQAATDTDREDEGS